MIDAKRIEEMKRLSAEAVKGPWERHKFNGSSQFHVLSTATDDEGYHAFQAEIEREKDAQFIAESRQFVPDIIAAYEEQAEELNRVSRLYSDCFIGYTNYKNLAYEQAEEIAKLRETLEEISEMFVWNSHIRDARKTAKEALAWRNTTRK